jgi:ribose transport system substrate-binding protein
MTHSLRLLLAASVTFAVPAALITSGLAQDKKLNYVAMSVADLGNPFHVQLAHGAESKAKEINPQVKFTLLSGDWDVNLQSKQIDSFISPKPDLIILGATDSKRIAPAVMRAKQAGITIVALHVWAEGGVDATLTSDNRQAGTLIAQYVADRLKGNGQIVILNGPPVTSTQDRLSAALEVFEKYPGIKILSQDQNSHDSTREEGLRIMTDLLTSFPKIDAVFCINDQQAIGAQLAASQAHRSEFFIVGVDG